MFKSRMKKEYERQTMFARKISWQLYLELSKAYPHSSLFPLDFKKTIFMERLENLKMFAIKAHLIQEKIPLISNRESPYPALQYGLCDFLKDTIYPFLSRWYVDYSHWWEQKNPKEDLLTYQRKFPNYKMFILDWETLHKKLQEYKGNTWLRHEGC